MNDKGLTISRRLRHAVRVLAVCARATHEYGGPEEAARNGRVWQSSPNLADRAGVSPDAARTVCMLLAKAGYLQSHQYYGYLADASLFEATLLDILKAVTTTAEIRLPTTHAPIDELDAKLYEIELTIQRATHVALDGFSVTAFFPLMTEKMDAKTEAEQEELFRRLLSGEEYLDDSMI